MGLLSADAGVEMVLEAERASADARRRLRRRERRRLDRLPGGKTLNEYKDKLPAEDADQIKAARRGDFNTAKDVVDRSVGRRAQSIGSALDPR